MLRDNCVKWYRGIEYIKYSEYDYILITTYQKKENHSQGLPLV